MRIGTPGERVRSHSGRQVEVLNEVCLFYIVDLTELEGNPARTFVVPKTLGRVIRPLHRTLRTYNTVLLDMLWVVKERQKQTIAGVENVKVGPCVRAGRPRQCHKRKEESWYMKNKTREHHCIRDKRNFRPTLPHPP